MIMVFFSWTKDIRYSLLLSFLFVLAIPVVRADDAQSRMDQLRRDSQSRMDKLRRDSQNRMDQLRRNSPQRQAEMLRQLPQHQPSLNQIEQYRRDSKERQAEMLKQLQQRQSSNDTAPSDNMKGTSFEPLPFSSNQAPAPDLCFLKFVTAGRSASTMEQLMPFLPYAQRNTLIGCQKNWSPRQEAEDKAEWLQSNPKMKANDIKFLSESPYQREFERLKDITAKVMRVRKCKITGPNKAELDVATRSNLKAKFNEGEWENFPYSTATIEMLGEGNYWTFSSYKDSKMHYKTAQ